MQIVHSGSARQVAQARDVLAGARRDLYRILADDIDGTHDADAGTDDPDGTDETGPTAAGPGE